MEKLMPNITIAYLPQDMINEVLLSKICNKEDILKFKIDSDATFSMAKTWTSKKYIETPKVKNVLIKYCLQITYRITNNNDGYVYLRLIRRK